MAGLLLFARGFLLTRVELKGESGCDDAAHLTPQREPRAEGAGCWAEAPVRKVVVLIIDGLRWDIAASQARSAVRGRLLALPTLLTLARERGAALLPFVADPPTTTQQRLKGLLTGASRMRYNARQPAQSSETSLLAGGLPTFVDVGDSFGAPALLEDNLVAALRRCGRRVALLGDDTWLQLFPASLFSVAHPFPSFNVADLHTVDDGVAAHLAPLLATSDGWDVLVAHFLGVDHAGHTHGVDSAEMAAKLAQMDAQAASVVEALASDAAHDGTLLLLLGDHGMTWAGDHGGASDEETRSALFAMRPRGGGEAERNTARNGADLAMPQLDFAATLALLLGVPVPFGSVGRVSAPLWAAAGGDAAGFSAARRANAWQVARAMDAYSAAGAFAPADVAALRRLYADAAESDDAAAANAFLAAAAALARAQWTTFAAAPMAAGLAVLAAALAAHAYTLHAAMPGSIAAADVHAPLAVAAGVIAAVSLAGPFSVGFMQVEQAASHAPMLAYAAASTLIASWRVLRGRASAAQLVSACMLLAATAAISAAAMPGEDKPAGADAAALPPLRLAAAAARALLPLVVLPAALLPRGKARSAGVAAAAWACHAAVALHWAAHDAAAAGWPVPPDAARAARLLLPRGVFAVGAGMALAAATGVARGAVSSPDAASRHALTALIAPLLLLTGRSAPMLALLAAAQTAALLRCHAACTPPDAAHAPAGANTATRPAAPLTRCGVLSLAVASHFAALQLFGATGHRSSFDALHFKAAFTVRHAFAALLLQQSDKPPDASQGFDEFGFARQGALLAANTWAAELVAYATLPALAHFAAGGDLASSDAFWRSAALLLATRGLLHASGAAAATAAAAVLRRHLHVWSLFAPKFVFEAARLLLTDALALAALAAAAMAQRRAKLHTA